MNFRMV